ncbi:hypothetical protein K505DRAFT_366829 [Melanomma pulvis-pyrius CBS 109.77]|uniref:DUF7730 domain-containing protein n=1 Tax=Melanomma pulvis-pyrius CBS 109.77 TaxID=1314802 RepID=A0A6A6WVT9_9PLEO|nr:hypothetical protein K505DRAFT_366829 [Melanomma pulvis-pyrius CBS 109.77]
MEVPPPKPNINCSQLQSPLFAKLSTEIRLKIYAYVLNDRPFLHISYCYKRLGIQASWPNNRDEYSDHIAFRQYIPQGNFSYLAHNTHFNLLPLIKSCRLIYTEAIDLLYSGNTFDFRMRKEFVNFARSIPPNRLESIRFLNLDASGNSRLYHLLYAEEVLSRMKGLRSCYISFDLSVTDASIGSRYELPEVLQRSWLARVASSVNTLRNLEHSTAFIVEAIHYVPDEHRYEVIQKWDLANE